MEAYRQWRKSSKSGQSGNCVEVADLGTGIGVRDTKAREQGHLTVSPAEWVAFVDSLKK